MLVEHAFAKINLTLDVMGRRPDGYHEVDMVMQTIDLADVLTLEEDPAGAITLEANASSVPLDERNLAHVAARVFRANSGVNRGVRILIDKQIPVAAGLAGGSADAAAVLRGLNRLWGTGKTTDELAAWGAAIGSDVPFCVRRGCAVARGRGERLEPVNHRMHAWVVLVRPPVFVSTGDVYGALRAEEYSRRPRSPEMVRALAAGDFEAVRAGVHNVLAPVTFRLYPEVARLAERVRHVAGVPVHMSGSGPTLFCLLPTRGSAQRVYHALRGFMREVYLCRFLPSALAPPRGGRPSVEP
ncbi:MAG: 4-(cytidine 5'-diphospho)-2-C-methyl-D-erythritol kinase [Alicyclobacillus sp.]|nr:4-(cytidine 5'-diphospho)-2-C-methyl-D-erythritol kinase [Alicyclobacillus sp.]MCL6516631.1 4-(cytidine 5'-diphospho)-2-C-methyl-D-erythritol kinase [Alicyclobacillus sp.]